VRQLTAARGRPSPAIEALHLRERRAVAALALLAPLLACAQPGNPPGGPPDEEPPALVRVRPDSGARNVREGSITFEFDEVVSERPQSAPTLADLFSISPSPGELRLSWRRTRVEIAPRGGLRPNTTYLVRMLPGLMDLDSNVDSAGAVVIFSTGPDFAGSHIAGRVFDWVAGRASPRAFVEAVALPDSARYVTAADSGGAFEMPYMRPGRYLLRAIVDQNRNRRIDSRELFDSVTVDLGDSLRRDMLAAVRDSLGPGLATVEIRDSTRLRVTLDRPLDTAFVATPAVFVLRAADSSDFPIAAVRTQADLDRVAADSLRRQQVQDSVRRAAREDSIRRADTVRVARPQPPTRRPGAQVAPPAVPRADSARPPEPKPSAAIPLTTLFLELRRPLTAGTAFRLRASGLRSITGAVRSSDRLFTTPRARPRADTSAARRDTAPRGPGRG
jgi:hypothetical protein